MKYDVTYGCGHKGQEDLIGKESERIRLLNWVEANKLCPECYKKQQLKKFEEEKYERAELYKKLNICPFNYGSQKQIEAAEHIRYKIAKRFYAMIDVYTMEDEKDKILIQEMLENVDQPRFYIENRYNPAIEELYKYEKKKYADRSQEKDLYVSENTLQPKVKKFDEIPEITMGNQRILVRFRYDQNLIKLLKSLYYLWDKENSIWYFGNVNFIDDPEDRAAETCSRILNEGYSVICPYKNVIEKVKNGNWKPLSTRKVFFNKEKKAFAIKWLEKNDDLYKSAKSIRGSYYKNGFVYVPYKYYNEIKDFADNYNFELSHLANMIINQSFANEVNFDDEIVINTNNYNDNKLKEILNNRDIPKDILDD